MFQPKSLATKSVMSTLVDSNMVTALAGNGSVFAILTRFKRLRTFPNILLANLALVNLLFPLLNMPIFLSEDVLEAGQFEDENSPPLVTSSIHHGFILLNLASTVALMLDRFLAVYIELRYYIWKTRKKAFLIAALIWFSCSLLVAFTILPALGIDQAHGSLEEYQWLIYEKRRPYITSAMVFFIMFAVGVGLMTIYAIHHKEKQENVVLHIVFPFGFSRRELNLSRLQAKTRLRLDTHVNKTVALTVAGILICHAPTIAFAIFAEQDKHFGNAWFQFFAVFSPFVLSATNPMIHGLRAKGFYSSLQRSLKSLSGKARFQGKTPSVMSKKTKSEKNPKEEASESKIEDGGQEKETKNHPSSKVFPM